MSSQNGDTPGQRKSTRTRHKRSLGDDFIVPERNPKTVRNSPAPQTSAQSSSVILQQMADKVTNTVVREIKEELDMEKEAVADSRALRKSSRTPKPSAKLVMAEKVSPMREVKQEPPQSPMKEVKQEIQPEEEIKETKPIIDNTLTTAPVTQKPPEPSSSVVSRCPAKLVVNTRLRKPTTSTNHLYSFPKPVRPFNRLNAKNYNPSVANIDEIARQERNRITEEEETRLNAEAAAKVAEIRAANVKKILDKRSVGRISTGRQAIAQDQEISRHMASSTKAQFKRTYEEGTIGHLLRNQLPTSTPKPQFIKVSNRTVVVPPGRDQHTMPPLPLKIARMSHQLAFPPKTGFTSLEPPPMKIPKTEEREESGGYPNTTTKKFFVVSNHHYQKAQHGTGPTAVRTITVMPSNSMHLGKDGSPPGPSNVCRNIPRQAVGMPPVSDMGPDGLHRFGSSAPKAFPSTRVVSPSIDHTYCTNPNKDKKKPKKIPENLVSANSFRKPDNTVQTEYRPANVDPRRLLHPHQPQIIDPSLENKMEETKPSLLDVKTEPVDDFMEKVIKEEVVDDIEDYFMAEQKPDLFDKALREEVVETMVEVKKEVEEHPQIPEETPSEPRAQSPLRIYLGSKEPIKDLDDDRYRFSGYTIKRVKKFTAKDLRPFGKRPPNAVNTNVLPGAKGLSVVLLPDLTLEDAEEEEEEIDEEELAKEKRRIEELVRQEQALTSRFSKDASVIRDYMQSEDFKKTLKPESEMTKFEKILCQHNALAKIPAFSETLSRNNPTLYSNLLRISGVPQEKEEVPPVPIIQKKEKELYVPPRISGPVKVDMKLDEGSSSSNTESKDVKLLKVIWNDVTAQVPDQITCHLCDDMMRLCMRRSNYRGELREYPAYRCLRKGCQTFRSIKKIIEGEPLRPKKKPEHVYIGPPRMMRPGYALMATDPLRKYVADAIRTNREQEFGSTPRPKPIPLFMNHEADDDDELVEWADYPDVKPVPAPYDDDKVIDEYMNEGYGEYEESDPEPAEVEEPKIKQEVVEYPEEQKPIPFMCDAISS